MIIEQMNKMNRVRKGLLIAIAFLFCGSVALLRFYQMRRDVAENQSLTAIGLRGASKITKPLSSLQKERLEKHFLESPPAAHESTDHAPRYPVGVLNEVSAINEFNKRQKK